MRAKLTFPLSVAFAAAFAAQIEGMTVTRWASNRSTVCAASSPGGACELNGTISFLAGTFLAGTFFAVETLAATLAALVLYRNGKRFSAAVTATGLVAALAIEHAWLLAYPH
jgi:hypothetical protein